MKFLHSCLCRARHAGKWGVLVWVLHVLVLHVLPLWGAFHVGTHAH